MRSTPLPMLPIGPRLPPTTRPSLDTIDLSAIGGATVQSYGTDAQGDLVVNLAGTSGGLSVDVQLAFAPTTVGQSLSGTFSTVSDGQNGTLLETSVACFARGTLILTERGEVEVERLAVGDRVITASGALRPIRWLGHRRLDIVRHADPRAVWPVRVLAGAFGDGRPRRDLWLSPGHNIAVEGALVPISSLINGLSVAQIKTKEVEYWHVEFDAHDLLLAEGLPAESYLDTGNRTAFANGGDFVQAHPDFAPKHWAETCLPLVKEGPLVRATKALLLARLSNQGKKADQEADAHLIVDGQRIEPIHVSESRLAFVLPTGGREIVLRSNVFIPAHINAESADLRELGLCVGRLQIDGSNVALVDDQICAAGWRDCEFADEGFSHRWTTGASPLPAGARIVMVDLVGPGYYWRTPSDRALAISA